MRTIPSTNIVSVIDDEAGNLLIGTTPSAGATLPTTAATFAAGAEVTDESTGIKWRNVGTIAVPVWDMVKTTKIIALTAANIIAMYTTPVAIIAAVPGKTIVIDGWQFVITRTSTAFTGGGVVDLQYAATAHGAGTLVSATTIAATAVTGAAGKTYSHRTGADFSDVASATLQGIGVFISNATAAYAAGTGTASVKVSYHLVS